MKINQQILKLLSQKNLAVAECENLFTSIFSARCCAPTIKTVLLLEAYKGEKTDEIYACFKALKKIEKPIRSGIKNLIDTCGTGGDGKNSINVSTLAAFVIAGAGGKVAKHGNRAISSKCGSSDLLEAVGINLSASKEKMISSIKKYGIGYFHAPYYHPAFTHLQKIRKKIKRRTILNYLGPLINPLDVQYQVMGVSKINLIDIYSQILKYKKYGEFLVCHSVDGLDEISPFNKTFVSLIAKGEIQRGFIDRTLPSKNFTQKKSHALKSIAEHKNFALNFLKNKIHNSDRVLILLNAAAGLVLSHLAINLTDGYKKAEKSLAEGKAYRAYLGLKKISNS